MIYERRYVQFNDLVFDGFDMISDWDGDVLFKGSSTEIVYGHGSYRPFKANYLYVSERTVSMTITLKMHKLHCEFRPYYIRFVDEQLAKPGKLWCVKNNELLWAMAAVESISENYSRKNDQIVYDISFVIPGGVWHKADKDATFLVPWDVCTFMDCLGYKTVGSCDCCEACDRKEIESANDCCCCCDDNVTKDMALCKHLDDLQSYYGCDVRYRIVYDCERADRFRINKHPGQKLCVEDICDDSIIAGQVYSETEIPTEDVTVILTGQFYNPWIKINDNINIIEGEYNGSLYIYPNGDLYYLEGDNECCDPVLLDPTLWVVPEGNEYGWTINPGNNGVVVYLNTCCTTACVYIQTGDIAL